MNRRNILKTIYGFLGVFILPIRLLRKKTCVTGSDVAGPFHRENAPLRTDLSLGYDGKGTPLVVSGVVYDSDCSSPIEEVLIDIWHASPAGEYDQKSQNFLFRGRMKTDNQGRYRFNTLLPSHYTDGGLDRPKHIHYRVTSNHYRELTTQLYFTGDKRLEKDIFIKQNNGWERVMPLVDVAKGKKVEFDIFIEKDN